MKFGNKLHSLQYPAWAPYYLDYNGLKKLLEDDSGYDDNHDDAVPPPPPLSPAGSAFLAISSPLNSLRRKGPLFSSRRGDPLREDMDSNLPSVKFLDALNEQVEKIVLFYVQEQGRIAYQLVELRQEQLQFSNTLFATASTTNNNNNNNDHSKNEALSRILVLRDRYHAAGMQLYHLIQFVDVNVTAIRKILKKHDKTTHTSASSYYLVGGHRRSSLMMKPLLADATLTSLCITLEAALTELKQQEQQLLLGPLSSEIVADNNMESSRDDGSNRASHQKPPRPKPPQSSTTGHHVRSNTDPISATAIVMPSPVMNYGGGSSSHRRTFSAAYYAPYALSGKRLPTSDALQDEVLVKIYAARNRLKQTSGFVELLATELMMEPSEQDELDEKILEDEEATKYEERSWISNQLNLLSTFLYMTNYYIVAPTSGSYAEKVGANVTLSATIIGMTPVAALVSTLLYSWWTSRSYKWALIFASVCSAFGNLFYACGLPYGSLKMILIGRLLNGFGSARSINRRYIADTFSRSERTAASAAFVTAGALGMAAGPAIASMLDMVAATSTSLYWQVENAPGWVMCGFWSTYLVCLILFFRDPPQKHETMNKESSSSSSKVELSTAKVGEAQPLLANGNDVENASELPIWKNVAVMTTFGIYFVLKLVLECILSSSGTLTHYYFGWTGTISGAFLAVLGLLMLPANYGVAYLSRIYEDRDLIVGMQLVMLVGCLMVVNYGSVYTYNVAQYAIASVVIFLSTNALEGPNMSLLSKTIPKSWSKGMFNVGLLATEAGTLGRAVGDLFLSVCGTRGMQYLINFTFGSMSVISCLTLAISYHFYDYLEAIEKDD